MTYEYLGTVVRWIDGDTVELTLDLGFYLTYTNHFRLQGVDTPERGRPGSREATAYVNEQMPPGTRVIAVTSKGDKYGRFLVYAYNTAHDMIKFPSINAALLKAGLARPYDGGAKDAH